MTSEFFISRPAEVVKVISPKGEKSKIILVDGTEVWLNSGSSLEYPMEFNNKNRLVRLNGEGYFKVTKNEDLPFIVQTSSLNVKVLGTRFNVCAYDNDEYITTTLEEGSVQISDFMRGETLTLKPSQQAEFVKGTGEMKLLNVDTELVTSWKVNLLRFDNAPFSEVVKKIERWYDVKIFLDPNLKYSQRYTMTIKTESLQELLNLLSRTTSMEYEIKEDTVYINQLKKVVPM